MPAVVAVVVVVVVVEIAVVAVVAVVVVGYTTNPAHLLPPSTTELQKIVDDFIDKDPSCLRRFLKGNAWKYEDARAQLHACILWRYENNPWEFCPQVSMVWYEHNYTASD